MMIGPVPRRAKKRRPSNQTCSSSSPTNCSIGMPEARESRTAWRSRPTRTLPRGEGLYVFSVATGLCVKRVEVERGFVVNGPGISEKLGPMEIDRLLLCKVIWRGGCSGTWALEGSNTVCAINFSVRASGCFHDCFAGWFRVAARGQTHRMTRRPASQSEFRMHATALVHRPVSPASIL